MRWHAQVSSVAQRAKRRRLPPCWPHKWNPTSLEAANDAQHVAVQQEIDQLWQRLITNDPDVVLAVLRHAFQKSSAHAAPLSLRNAEAQLALLAPDPAALLERHPTTTAAGNLSLKKFTKGERPISTSSSSRGWC